MQSQKSRIDRKKLYGKHLKNFKHHDFILLLPGVLGIFKGASSCL